MMTLPLIEVVDTSKLYAIFDMPRQEFGKVRVGDKETVQTEGLTRDATVISVDPVMPIWRAGCFRGEDGSGQFRREGAGGGWMWCGRRSEGGRVIGNW